MSQGLPLANSTRNNKRPRPIHQSVAAYIATSTLTNDDATAAAATAPDDFDVGQDDELEDEDEDGDETEDDELNGGAVVDQPVGEKVRAQRRARVGTLVGFKDPELEYVLLQALDTVRPFDAEHGRKAATWEKVIEYLRKHDDKEERAGRPRVFGLVNSRVCRANWNALSDEYAKHLAKMRQTTGANPTLTPRLQLMGAVYDFEQSCKKTMDDKKEQGRRKRARIESNRVEGLAMMERSRTGYRMGPPQVEGARTTLTVDIPPAQPGDLSQSTISPPSHDLRSPGLFSGSESESNLSVVSSISAVRTPRTPGMKKRMMVDFASEGIKQATDALLMQGENQKRQLELMIQDQADRRASEEQRLRREESLRREQLEREEALRREQKNDRREEREMIQELVKSQSSTMQGFVKQQTETTERLILAIVGAFNKAVEKS